MIDWEEVRINAAISALQGVLESGKIGELLEFSPYVVAKQSVRLANCLVEELKKNKSNDDQGNPIPLRERFNANINDVRY